MTRTSRAKTFVQSLFTSSLKRLDNETQTKNANSNHKLKTAQVVPIDSAKKTHLMLKNYEMMEFLIQQRKIGVNLSNEYLRKIHQYEQAKKIGKQNDLIQDLDFLNFSEENQTSDLDDKKEKSSNKSANVDLKNVDDLLKITNTSFYTIAAGIASAYPEYAHYAFVASLSNILSRPITEKIIIKHLSPLFEKFSRQDEQGNKTIDPVLFTALSVIVALVVTKSLYDIELKKQFEKLITQYDNALEKKYCSGEECIKFIKINIELFKKLETLEEKISQKINDKSLTETDIKVYQEQHTKLLLKIQNNQANLNCSKEVHRASAVTYDKTKQDLLEFAGKHGYKDDKKHQDRLSDIHQPLLLAKLEKPGKSLNKFENKLNRLCKQCETMHESNEKALNNFKTEVDADKEVKQETSNSWSFRLW